MNDIRFYDINMDAYINTYIRTVIISATIDSEPYIIYSEPQKTSVFKIAKKLQKKKF